MLRIVIAFTNLINSRITWIPGNDELLQDSAWRGRKGACWDIAQEENFLQLAGSGVWKTLTHERLQTISGEAL